MIEPWDQRSDYRVLMDHPITDPLIESGAWDRLSEDQRTLALWIECCCCMSESLWAFDLAWADRVLGDRLSTGATAAGVLTRLVDQRAVSALTILAPGPSRYAIVTLPGHPLNTGARCMSAVVRDIHRRTGSRPAALTGAA